MNRKTRLLIAATAGSAAIAVAATGVANATGSFSPRPDPSAAHRVVDHSTRPLVPTRDAGSLRELASPTAVVAPGDSYWAIAERMLGEAANADVARLTKDLIDVNAPKLGYDDAAMLHPGDIVKAPTTAAAPDRPAQVAVAPARHVVAAGESYWAIAKSTLGAGATQNDILAKTEELMKLNSDRLGYDDPAMLHPGDVVRLARPVTPEAARTSTPEVTVSHKITVSPKANRDVTPTPKKEAVRVRTPDSPPLSERAIIATSKHAREESMDKIETPVWRNRWDRFAKPRMAPAAPERSVSAPGNDIAI